MNYRVNVFGFPNAKAAHQNVGLLDQRMVVEWTRDNIAAFGGDVNKMILWGQSAGGASVGMYGYSYPDDLIVQGLISDSGSTSTLAKPFGNYSDFSTLASLTGCGGLADREELKCMQRVDASVLQEVYSNTSSVSFTPVADNVTAFSNTTDRLARGLVTKVVSGSGPLIFLEDALTTDLFSHGSWATMQMKVPVLEPTMQAEYPPPRSPSVYKPSPVQ
jgi:carboxylesterase type B